jgi:hypothetical protein
MRTFRCCRRSGKLRRRRHWLTRRLAPGDESSTPAAEWCTPPDGQAHRCVGVGKSSPRTGNFRPEEGDRSFYMAEIWSRDGKKIEKMLYDGNRIEKAYRTFNDAAAERTLYGPPAKHRPGKVAGCLGALRRREKATVSATLRRQPAACCTSRGFHTHEPIRLFADAVRVFSRHRDLSCT